MFWLRRWRRGSGRRREEADGRLVTREETAAVWRPRSREKAREAGLVPPSAGPQRSVTEVGELPEEERVPARRAEKALISEAGRLAMTGGVTGVAKSRVTGAHASPEALVARDVWK